MSGLLARHEEHTEACFGGAGARTAGQLAAYVETLLGLLPEGVPGAQVVVACHDRYAFIAALLAVWQRGMVAALPANGQPETLRQLECMPQIACVLHDQDCAAGIDVRALEHPARSARPQVLRLPPSAPAVVAYTSGSTGAPAAHLKTFGQLAEESSMWIEHFGLGQRRTVAAVPSHHIYGLLFAVMMPLLGGGSVSRRTPKLPAEILHELVVSAAPVLIAVPPQLSALAAQAPSPLPRIEQVLSSAAPLPAATDRALGLLGLRVTQVLGSTETGGIAFRESCDLPWCALPDVLLDIDGEGVLSVRSPWASARPGEAVATADRVQLLDSVGGFRHLGRADAVVKVGGRRLDLGELEARLGAVPGVRAARVLANEATSLRGTELWAVVESDGVEVETLRAALLDHVDPVFMPRRFRVVPALPRGPSGKPTRAALLSLFEPWRYSAEGLSQQVECAGGEVHE